MTPKIEDYAIELSRDLEKAVAQLIMIDFSGTSMDADLERRMRETCWGGVILFAKNVTSRAQVAQLNRDLQAASSVSLLIAVDQEGGLVNRLALEDSATGCGNMALAATGSQELTYEVMRACGRELRSAGFNVDFAPCVDVNNNPENPIIGVRSFGESAEQVGQLGAAAVRGLRDGDLGTCAKHFPGHGDTHQDSHLALPTVDHPADRLESIELLPFARCIEAGVDGIMTAHIIYPALEPEAGLPATLSTRILTGLLREKMGFDGVVFTDSMGMKAIADNFGVGEAGVLSIQAGADMVLALGPEENQLETHRAIVEAVRDGRIPEARIQSAGRRVTALKVRVRAGEPHDGAPSTPADIDVVRRAAAASITVLRNPHDVLPFRIEARDRLLVVAPSQLPQSPLGEMMAFERLGTAFAELHPNTDVLRHAASPDEAEMASIQERARASRAVVLGLYARGSLLDAHRDLAMRLCETAAPLAVALLGSPYVAAGLPSTPALVASYNYTTPSLEAVARVMLGRLSPKGRCPVTIPGVCAEGFGITWL